MELTKLPPVAKSVYLFCSKCDCDRYHRVIAHISDTEAKIECEVCGKKGKLKIGGAKKKTTRKRTTRTKVTPFQVWKDLGEKHSNQTPQIYSIKGDFAQDSAIDHPKFGVGYVTASMSNKIEVVFEEGQKTLVHKRK